MSLVIFPLSGWWHLPFPPTTYPNAQATTQAPTHALNGVRMAVRIGSVVRCIYVNIQRMVTRLINTFEVQGQQACYVAHLFVHSFCKCVLGTFCGQTWSPIHRWIRWSPCPQSASSRKKSFPKTRRTLSMFFIFTNIEKFDPVIK